MNLDNTYDQMLVLSNSDTHLYVRLNPYYRTLNPSVVYNVGDEVEVIGLTDYLITDDISMILNDVNSVVILSQPGYDNIAVETLTFYGLHELPYLNNSDLHYISLGGVLSYNGYDYYIESEDVFYFNHYYYDYYRVMFSIADLTGFGEVHGHQIGEQVIVYGYYDVKDIDQHFMTELRLVSIKSNEPM